MGTHTTGDMKMPGVSTRARCMGTHTSGDTKTLGVSTEVDALVHTPLVI